MKKICTGIAPDFVRDWGVKEAVREILQNYLDSRTEFGVRGKVYLKEGRAVIRDYGPGIEMKHMALGISEKGEDAIGKFGKGLKQAILVMAREGRDVKIISQGRVICPLIEYNSDYETDILHLVVKEATGQTKKIQGTWISFDCSPEELEEGKNFFLAFKVKEVDYLGSSKQVLLPAGEIYVNGSKISDVEGTLFSYSLNHKQAEKVYNSERNIIDKDRLKEVVKELLTQTESKELIEELMASVIANENTFEEQAGLNTWNVRPESQDLWKEAFYSLQGEQAVITENEIMANEAGYRGYKPVKLPWEWQYNLKTFGVRTDQQVINELDKGGFIELPTEELSAERQSVLQQAIEIVTNYYTCPLPVIVSEDLNRPQGLPEEQMLVRGCYESEKEIIYLRDSILDDLPMTLEVLFHETVHKKTGFRDKTMEFQKALSEAYANGLLQAVSQVIEMEVS